MLRKSPKWSYSPYSFSFYFSPGGQTAHALLSAAVDPVNGFPTWYQDGTGVTLEQCNFSAASPDLNCIPAGPAVVPIPGIDFSEAF